MPSKPSLLLKEFSALLQQKNGVLYPSNLKRNGNFHTVVLRWMQACGSYMSWEHWLHVQKLQRFLLYCPYGLSRCRLQVFCELMSDLMIPATTPVFIMDPN